MRLKSIELSGFKSFAKKTELRFDTAVTSIVGPNGSGKSNIAESFRFVLGEQSMKSMRGRRGEDMIWNGSPAVARAGRASVKLVFDNTDRRLNLDFDEVTIERAVHRDGTNDYSLNGSHVRLRDISELLSQANIGSSGHHIISQGEADRILSSSPKDRREMIEDALGLTAYLYKREDAQKKLEKAAENMREVEALRRELSPHLKFLEKQVKKIEEGEKLREELLRLQLQYLAREHRYLSLAEKSLASERSAPLHEKKELEHRIEKLRREVADKGKNDEGAAKLATLESEQSRARDERASLVRELGRLEGEIEAHERLAKQSEGGTVPAKDAVRFAEDMAGALEKALSGDGSSLREAIQSLISRAREFVSRISQKENGAEQSIEKLTGRKQGIEKELKELDRKEKDIEGKVLELRRALESEKDASRDAERELFAAMQRRSEIDATLASSSAREESLAREKESLKQEVSIAAMFLGREILAYDSHKVEEEGVAVSDEAISSEPRGVQEDRRRKVERLKIKLEEIGAGNPEEVLKEHRETRERDEFLSRELQDLEASAESLKKLIAELTETLQTRFATGIDTISAQFDEFFKSMFGGGSAKLSLVKERRRRAAAEGEGDDEDMTDEEEEDAQYEEGIDIAVSLPHKRVKGLHMFSGGERALTSTALIFAMSQVNPPPFLILDETDAALDEANSRRYGDMIETLARKSQLILITHNRETMSRAGVLYGVTMGSDGVSKLLSVKFEEAVQVAK